MDEDDARSGLSLDDYAAKTATGGRDGLDSRGIEPDRIQALRDAAEFTVYTPGSEAGVPLNVVGSLAAPALSWDTEAETLRDEIEGIVDEPARARRHRGRPAVEPRARAAREPDRERVARRAEPRPRRR